MPGPVRAGLAVHQRRVLERSGTAPWRPRTCALRRGLARSDGEVDQLQPELLAGFLFKRVEAGVEAAAQVETVLIPRFFQPFSWCGEGWLVRTSSGLIQWAFWKLTRRKAWSFHR